MKKNHIYKHFCNFCPLATVQVILVASVILHNSNGESCTCKGSPPSLSSDILTDIYNATRLSNPRFSFNPSIVVVIQYNNVP